MGAVRAVGLPLEVFRDDAGDALVGHATCRITAGPQAVEVRAIEVAVLDAFGAGARRRARGVAVPGQLEPTASVRVRANATTEVSVWFEPVALGSAHDCRVVAALVVDGEPAVASCEVIVRDEGPALAR